MSLSGSEKQRLREFLASREKEYYIKHPNAERAILGLAHLGVFKPYMLDAGFNLEKLKVDYEQHKHWNHASFQKKGEKPYSRWEVNLEILAPSPFTVRQLQVLGGLASGLNTNDIAEYLDLASSTVNRTLKVIYRKLKIRPGNQTEAVAIALRNGWI